MNYQDCRRLLADELDIWAPERWSTRNKALRSGNRIIAGAYLNATDDGRGLAFLTLRSVRSSNFIRHRTVDKSLFDNVPPHEIRKEDAQCVNIRPKDGNWLESLRQLFGDSEPDTAKASDSQDGCS